jgi:hypothetical protein
MLKRDGWQALQEAQEGAMPRQLSFSFEQAHDVGNERNERA